MFASPTPGSVVKTQDGSLTLSHGEHGECFHNQAGAETEARELNVKASGFEAAAATRPVAVLDVGLGLGYNALVTIEAWSALAAARPLRLVSLEIDGGLVSALQSGEAPWQANWDRRRLELCRALRRDGDVFRLEQGPLSWEIHVVDARVEPVPVVSNAYDFIWQDPFSPEKNPDMWDASWFTRVRPLVAPTAVLMTYSVARSVRDALTASGWVPERIASRLPPKRHWLKASPAAAFN